LLPTVTVTVAALATPGRRGIIEVIITANTANQREEVFIASMIWHLAVVACNIAKVTGLLLLLALREWLVRKPDAAMSQGRRELIV
jgi:hypothetical protein